MAIQGIDIDSGLEESLHDVSVSRGSGYVEHGFSAERFEDVSDSQFSRGTANSTPAPEGQLGLAVYVDNLAEKAGNARRSLEDGQVRYVRGVFRVN